MTDTAQQNTQQDCVLIDTQPTHDGFKLGILTLNDPKALNALSVDMCRRLSEQLSQWEQDSSIVAIMLRGAGDKAFCAGGNIRKLYDSMCENPPLPNPYAKEFFGSEYALYRQMHFYPKPLILWGNGIVMGGGMGLMAACSHRIVTETTRFAMPEITIGLFPDATGSWFLQRMPAKMGLFLGLTGAMCQGSDAMLANLAEYAIASEGYDEVVKALSNANWSSVTEDQNSQTAHDITSHALATLSQTAQNKPAMPASKLAQYWQVLHALMNVGGLADIDALLQDDDKLTQFVTQLVNGMGLDSALIDGFMTDKWTQKALATYRHGCPVTAVLTYELFYKVKDLSLEQVLYLEANVATHCADKPDFQEGVRALLIDKDKSPNWSKTLADCLTSDGQAYIESHFSNPYGENHPFASWLTDSAWGNKWVKG
ncbi:enoyl-CoA hydratase/isomerase family protein [Psychrobacter sp. I-STPA6b]|uniref:enoyl-CoA hydratase/isomerase family protein n=1 Tax=Psychrobacter sp. I-STPA6b TaxID=2585718 RepID=UPI001D0C9FAB|nr:enoyl-CoA hydratase/isomerase family protein [Psychrobacter sp. I-STPA6b]